jgi:outer membrane protein
LKMNCRPSLLASVTVLAAAVCDVPAAAQDASGSALSQGAATEPSIAGPLVFLNQTEFPAETANISDAGISLPGFLAAGGAFDSKTPDIVGTIGAGVEASPAYFGSNETEMGVDFIGRFVYIRFPKGFKICSGHAVGFRTGFGLRGSARYIRKRESSDYSEINGLDDVPWTFEGGLGIGYEQKNYRVFGDVRYGIIGSNAWVGDLGADAIAYPIQGLTVTLGPRLNFGSDNYMDAYFGISGSESTKSGLAQYDPSSGLYSGGILLTARYLINERWGVEGEAAWERLLDDASDSPIVQQGSKDQYGISLNLTRRISLDF